MNVDWQQALSAAIAEGDVDLAADIRTAWLREEQRLVKPRKKNGGAPSGVRKAK